MSLLLFAMSGSGGPAAEYPTVSIEIAFGHTWQDESPIFTDVSDYVEFESGFTIRRGRSRELDTFQAGTANWTLRSDDRRFDPLYAAGPHYGDLEDRVPCRIRSTYDGLTYDLFYGYIDAWPQSYTTGDNVALVDIVATDGFAILAGLGSMAGAFTLDDATLGVLDEDRLAGGGVEEELSGARIDALLDVSGWPQSLRDIATGSTLCQTQEVDEEMLASIQLVELSEDGFFYMKGNGDAVFHGRQDRQSVSRLATVQRTFSDADANYVYDNLVIIPRDVQYVANDVRRQRDGGVEQQVTSAASISKRGRITDAKSGLVMSSDAVAFDIATIHLLRHAEPGTRVDDLIIDPANAPEYLWPEVLGREILDRIEVERTPQQTGDAIVLEVLIQGIEHSWQSFQWVTRWYVTPADSFSFFTLDDATLGVLDEDLLGA